MIIPINLSIWFWIYNYDIMKRHWLPGEIQLTPSPINPELHTHANSPIVLVQAALAWQLWVPVVHSSMSEYIKMQWIIYISIYMSFYVSMFILPSHTRRLWLFLTSTRCSGATETRFASTCETSICVGAVGIGMTVMGVRSAFVYIWRYTKCFEM